MTAPSTLLDLALRAAAAHPDRGFRFCRAGEVQETLSFRDLDARARGLAVLLRRSGLEEGDRALLVYEAGLEQIAAFWGCVYAGVVPVPSVPPQRGRLSRTLPRLLRIASDCGPRALLSSGSVMEDLPEQLAPLLISAADVGDGASWSPPQRSSEELALLQYTSGSTRQPRGVMLSHRNLLHNLEMIADFHRRQSAMVMVHWLPLFHDMGLIRGMLSPVQMCGSAVLLDPLEFVSRPLRWVQALSKFGATVTGAPNFGYGLVSRKVSSEQVAGLDLSSLEVAFCSAEPIRAACLRRFSALLGPAGLRPQALKPAYGLAEATVMVSGEMGPQWHSREISREALGRSVVERPQLGSDTVEVVNCGTPLGGQQVIIVGESGDPCSPEVVGEIWLSGPSVAKGYWNHPADEGATFGAYLRDGQGPFLRTGDLGWLEPDGSLSVCGRLKDLLIVRGQNFWPQDLEASLEEALDALRPGCTVAFQMEDGSVAVAAETTAEDTRLEELARAVWAKAGEEFGLSLGEVWLLAPGTLPKTASGKVQRGLTRTLRDRQELPARFHWKAPERSR